MGMPADGAMPTGWFETPGPRWSAFVRSPCLPGQPAADTLGPQAVKTTPITARTYERVAKTPGVAIDLPPSRTRESRPGRVHRRPGPIQPPRADSSDFCYVGCVMSIGRDLGSRPLRVEHTICLGDLRSGMGGKGAGSAGPLCRTPGQPRPIPAGEPRRYRRFVMPGQPSSETRPISVRHGFHQGSGVPLRKRRNVETSRQSTIRNPTRPLR
jgi:hypothetical protein